MDQSGKILQDIKLPKDRLGTNYVLSPDGSKAAYVESNSLINSNNNPDASIKVIDTKTGVIKEIVKASSLNDKNAKVEYRTVKKLDKDSKNVEEKKVPIIPAISSNIYWDSTSTALTFVYGNADSNTNKISTYVVSFDK